MKTVLNILVMLMMALFLFSACEMEIEHVMVDPAQSVAPTLLAQKDIIVNKDNSKVEAVVFNWTSASFGVPTQIQYALHLTLGDTLFWRVPLFQTPLP